MRDIIETNSAFDVDSGSGRSLNVGTGASIVVATAAMIALVLTVLIASFAPASAGVPGHELSAIAAQSDLVQAGLTVHGEAVMAAAREGNFAISEGHRGTSNSLASVLVWVVVLGASGALAAYTRDRMERRR